jgi:predicted lipid carrier protein YhbT
VATAAEVERSIRTLAKRLAEASVDPSVVPDRTIMAICPDLDIAYRMELKDAKLRGLKQVASKESADARITARSDDLIALLEGRLNAATAFLTGKVRIDAPAKDLMMLRRLF